MNHQAAPSAEASEATSSSWLAGLERHCCRMEQASPDGLRKRCQGFSKGSIEGSQVRSGIDRVCLGFIVMDLMDFVGLDPDLFRGSKGGIS